MSSSHQMQNFDDPDLDVTFQWTKSEFGFCLLSLSILIIFLTKFVPLYNRHWVDLPYHCKILLTLILRFSENTRTLSLLIFFGTMNDINVEPGMIICRVLHLLTLYSKQTSLSLKRENDTNIIWQKYIYHVLHVNLNGKFG